LIKKILPDLNEEPKEKKEIIVIKQNIRKQENWRVDFFCSKPAGLDLDRQRIWGSLPQSGGGSTLDKEY
jgi:hypothetical protein